MRNAVVSILYVLELALTLTYAACRNAKEHIFKFDERKPAYIVYVKFQRVNRLLIVKDFKQELPNLNCSVILISVLNVMSLGDITQATYETLAYRKKH